MHFLSIIAHHRSNFRMLLKFNSRYGDQTVHEAGSILLTDYKIKNHQVWCQVPKQKIFMLSRIKEILNGYGFVLYTRPYQLNIVGLRSKSVNSNQFDDEIHVFYIKEDGKWNY